MGFDDIFEQGSRHNKHGYGHRSEHNDHDDYYNRSHSQHPSYDFKRMYLEKIQHNPKLKILIAVGLIVIIGIIIIVAVLLFQLILKIFRYLMENGIEGFINAIWKGSK